MRGFPGSDRSRAHQGILRSPVAAGAPAECPRWGIDTVTGARGPGYRTKSGRRAGAGRADMTDGSAPSLWIVGADPHLLRAPGADGAILPAGVDGEYWTRSAVPASERAQ